MTLLFQGKVEVIEEHDVVIRSVRLTFKIPSILRLHQFVRNKSQNFIRFSRENIYVRDDFCCQYCGEKFVARHLTLDHVKPVSQGGKKSWTNIVTACIECNQAKGGCTPEEAGMALIKRPIVPTWLPKVQVNFSIAQAPESWRAYLMLSTG